MAHPAGASRPPNPAVKDPQFNYDNAMTWNYLPLVADRQQLLSRELAQAVTDQPALLNNDGVLALITDAHRGDENLASILTSRLDDGTNTPGRLLFADPRQPGLAPDAVRERLRSLFRPAASGTCRPSPGTSKPCPTDSPRTTSCGKFLGHGR